VRSCQAQGHERPLGFRVPLAQASSGATRKIATDLRPACIDGTDELAGFDVDLQRPAMPADHQHVGAHAIESDQPLHVLTEPREIVTGNPNERRELREAARTAR
jgi:hypothetical protein